VAQAHRMESQALYPRPRHLRRRWRPTCPKRAQARALADDLDDHEGAHEGAQTQRSTAACESEGEAGWGCSFHNPSRQDLVRLR